MIRKDILAGAARVAAVIALAWAVGTPAIAQDDDQGEIDEIIVTATKREQSIQDVPIAVSAFQADELENRGIEELEDLNQISPSISVYNSNSSSNGGTLRIRGVGTTGNNPGLESAVGTFIDGVYRSRSGQAFQDFVDVERIEILRGPQGTLFGKNTSAGAVSVITKKPAFEFGGHVAVSYGNFNAKKVQASLTGPILDDVLAFRFSGAWRQQDGYYEDFNSTDAYAERDRYSVKGQLLYTPTEDFQARVIVDYTKLDESCCPAAYLANGPTAAIVRALGGDIVGLTGADPSLAGQISLRGPRNDNFDPREVGVNFKPKEKVKDWGALLDMTWEIAEITIRSITSYREYDSFRAQDIDFSSADILRPQDADDLFKNFSQEFQFIGTSGDLDWLVGFYVYSEDIDTDEEILFSTQGGAFVDALFGSPGIAALFPDRAGYSAKWTTETDGWAVFTNNTYHLTEQLDLTVGLRYSHEEKDATARINGAQPDTINPINGAVGVINQPWCDNLTLTPVAVARSVLASLCDNVSWDNSATEREWTGTASLSYAVTEDMNVYGTYSRGYKAGGFNLDQESFDSTIDPATGLEVKRSDNSRFEPEFVNAFELGIKSTWLDGAMTVNIAGFLSKFSDFQLNSFNGLGFTISNLPQVESRGFELEMFWAVTEALTINVGATFADARYGEGLSRTGSCTTATPGPSCTFLDAPTGGNTNIVDQLDGKRLTYAPAWNGSFAANYEHTIPGTEWLGRFVWNMAYRGRTNTGSDLHPLKLVKDVWFQNVRLTATSPDGVWEVSVWSNNLSNEFVPMVVFNSVFQSGSLSTFVNEPRTFGLTVKYTFGEDS